MCIRIEMATLDPDPGKSNGIQKEENAQISS
jgi:hypothetical protein